MRLRVGACATLLTAAWMSAAIFVAAGVPASAQNARWGASYFPDVTLTTHEGKQVRFYDDLIKGKIVALDLIYTTCQYACPLETARLAQVQKLIGDRMGKDVFFYSISIDPENDTPEVLKAYAEKFHTGPGWLFLTGKKSEIDEISKKLGLYSDPAAGPDGHTPHLLIGNEATGQWMRNSSLDNAKFLATTIGSWLNSWQTAARPTRSYADAPKIDFDPGEYAFSTKCAACHTIGRGDQIGPDLLGVTTRRDRKWLTRFIVAPDRVIAERDPVAIEMMAKYKQVTMPAIGLAESDATLILDYLAKQKAPVVPGTPAASAPSASQAPAKAAASTATGVFQPYFEIQRALNADLVTPIAPSARALATDAATLGAAGEGMRQAALTLAASAGSLASARASFDALSVAVMRYAASVPLAATTKIAYCPMAGKYWLQQGETIQNPYYGRAMSDCGRLVPTIPAL